MGRTALKYGAVLIGVYLGVFYATGAGTLLDKGQAGVVNEIKALQGR